MRLGFLRMSFQQKQAGELQRQGFRPGPRLSPGCPSPGEGGGFLPVLGKGTLGKHISRRRDLALAGAGDQRGEPTNRKGGPRAHGWRTPSFMTAPLLGEGC